MSNIDNGALGLDTPKLAQALDGGIGQHKDTIPGMLPSGERLRHPVCGLAATSLYLFLKSKNMRPSLVISEPGLTFDAFMTHVFVMVGDGAGEQAVDPTYSQFLSYVNLHPYYEAIVKYGLMPAEQIAVFDMQHRQGFTQNLAQIAATFQAADPYSAEERLRQFRISNGELAAASQVEIQSAYNAIWDPVNIEEFSPDPYVLERARTVAAYMLKKVT